MIGIAAVEAPWGPIHLAANADGVVALEVLTTPDAFASSVRRRLGEAPGRGGPTVERQVEAAVRAVEAFLARDPAGLVDLPFRLYGLTAWIGSSSTAFAKSRGARSPAMAASPDRSDDPAPHGRSARQSAETRSD